eukprot:gene1757-3392_t
MMVHSKRYVISKQFNPETAAGSPMRVRQYLATQNHWAAIQVQRVWRGYYCREQLWSIDGFLTACRVIRIQRLWRGYFGRRLAMRKYYDKLARAATKIKITFLCMKARVLLRRLKAEHLYYPMVTLQRQWRVRITRRKYLERLRIWKYNKSRAIQALVRRYLGRRRALGVRTRVEAMDVCLLETHMKSAVAGGLSSKKGRRVVVEEGEVLHMGEWALLDTILRTLLATDTPYEALSLCTHLVVRFPVFTPGIMALQCCLLYLWPNSDKARLQQQYETQPQSQSYTLIQSQKFPSPSLLTTPEGRYRYTHGSDSLPPSLIHTDPVSRFHSVVDEIQLVYFATALKRFRQKDGIRVISAMGCWLCVVSSWSSYFLPRNHNLPTTLPEDKRQHYNQIDNSDLIGGGNSTASIGIGMFGRMASTDPLVSKSQSLFSQALALTNITYNTSGSGSSNSNSGERVCCLRRLEVSEGLWGRRPELLKREAKMFKDTFRDIGVSYGAGAAGGGGATGGEGMDGQEEEEGDRDEGGSIGSSGGRRGTDDPPPVPCNDPSTSTVVGVSNVLDLRKPATSMPRLSPSPSPSPSTNRSMTLSDKTTIHQVSSSRRKPFVTAQISIYRTGEMLVICGEIISMAAMNDKKMKNGSVDTGRSDRDSRRQDGSSKSVSASQSVSESQTISASASLCPVVLLPKEVDRLYERSLSSLGQLWSLSEAEVRKKGRWHNLVRLVAWSGGRARLHGSEINHHHHSVTDNDNGNGLSVSINRCYRITLPIIEFTRLERNHLAMEQYSVRMIQRTYRGSHARFLYRRLCLRARQRDLQYARTVELRTMLAKERTHRRTLVCLLQSVVRRWLVRCLLFRWNTAALKIQTAFRRLSAKLFVIAEHRRRLLGPDVVEMFRRGMEISGLALTLVVKRCGHNYLLEGWDRVKNLKYSGLVLQQEIEHIVKTHNNNHNNNNNNASRSSPLMPPPHEGGGVNGDVNDEDDEDDEGSKQRQTQTHSKTKKKQSQRRNAMMKQSPFPVPLQLWHHQHVVELLVTQLALTSTISATTTELGAGRLDHQTCITTVGSDKSSGVGIEHINSLMRGLADQQDVVDRYNKVKAGKGQVMRQSELLAAQYLFKKK